VQFKYLDEGILVKGSRYPLVKMDFVDGVNLNKFVGKVINDPRTHSGKLKVVADQWMGINSSLRTFRIAHNDLQHGNVMIEGDHDIRLVDYDSFFLPESEGESPEGGHGNYQHPKRRKADYNEHVDNFPAFVIYLSLLALHADPTLWETFGGDQNILFKEDDFKDPVGSECFLKLKGSTDNRVRVLTRYLERYCAVPLDRVPNLDIITATENAGQTDAPLSKGASNSQTTASQPASPTAPPSNPSPGQPQAPAAPVQNPSTGQPSRAQPSGAVNPASATRRRQTQQAATPTAASSTQQVRRATGPTVIVGHQTTAPQTQQGSSAGSIVAGTVNCSRGHQNDATLIYCDIEQCAAVLYAGNNQCSGCNFVSPANARFCPQCANELS
jgi:hypothetical protein